LTSTDAKRETLLEQIGLQQRLFTGEEVERARHVARQQGLRLSDLLVEQGTLTAEQARGLERAVTYRIGRDQDKNVAKIIVDSKYCDPNAVEAALKKQKEFYAKTGELMRLGTLLVQSFALTESQKIAAHKIHEIESTGPTGSGSHRP
jgi:hypothetical protein